MNPNKPGDPVGEFVEMKRQRKQRDIDLWHQWNNNGRQPEHLEPLMDAFKPMVHANIKKWKPPTVNQSAFEAHLEQHVLKGVETYNPDRGAALSTHVQNHMRKGLRFVYQHQNIGYIPEDQIRRIGPLQRSTDELQEQFGRPPTSDEIADHMGVPKRRVEALQRSMRRDIPSSHWESDPAPQQASREQEVLHLLRPTLTQDEQVVFDHIYGLNGQKQELSTGVLAKKLGKQPSYISRIKSSIATKSKGYL